MLLRIREKKMVIIRATSTFLFMKYEQQAWLLQDLTIYQLTWSWDFLHPVNLICEQRVNISRIVLRFLEEKSARKRDRFD
jgi:hypothetical protein